jgi:hypothetical protein
MINRSEKPNGFNRTLGHITNEYGLNNEKRVEKAFTQALAVGAAPDWITGYRVASQEDQENHLDAWVETDAGPIAVQIKSSLKAIQNAKLKLGKRSQNIAYFYTSPNDSDEQIIKHCSKVVLVLRNKYLERKNKLP